MIIALIGSHGTGKTTIFNIIKDKYPKFQYFSEPTRHQTTALGYNSPYEIVEKFGIGTFELMNINSWSVIDPKINTTLDINRPIITDRSALDNYSYYLTLRNSEYDFYTADLIKEMTKYYCSLIDLFIYFPVGIFELVGDEMRIDNTKHQIDVDNNLVLAFKELDIPKSKVYTLKSISINDRTNEILKLIEAVTNNNVL